MTHVNTARPKADILLDGYRLGSDQGSIAFCSITLVEGSDENGTLKRILVDTGHTGRRPELDAMLLQRGLTRDSINVVVCTHAHWDRVENIDMFPRAAIVLHTDERRYASSPHRNDFACPEWIDAVLTRFEDRVRTVDEGTSLLPGVEVVTAPGHSAGTIAVTIASDDRRHGHRGGFHPERDGRPRGTQRTRLLGRRPGRPLDSQAAGHRGHHLPRPRPPVPAHSRRSARISPGDEPRAYRHRTRPARAIFPARFRTTADHHARHRRAATAVSS